MKIAIKTFGCKANSVDTDSLYFEARRRGLDVVSEAEWADAYVINSCTVTANADRDARLQANRFKRQNPAALVALIGCYGQVAKEELLQIQDLDLVLGTANKHRVLDHFQAHWVAAEQGHKPERDQHEGAVGFLPEKFQGSRYSRASIKIQDGCNFSCSYCIIPMARGRSRSLPLETVLAQYRQAAELGFNETVLTGIHLAHYGWDVGTNLEDLLKALIRSPGPRIRLSTLDPFEIPDSLIELVNSTPQICPHYHIALQSGSDRVLKSMRRLYKAHEFVDVTQKIGRANPNTFVGVDVIVGFHNEGETEFRETIRCLEESFWTKLHVFSYSMRKGTRAEVLGGAVSQATIADRSARLRHWSDKVYYRFLDSQLGKSSQVILEKPSTKYPGYWQGHTENYVSTLTPGDRLEEKKIYPCKLIERTGDRMITTNL